MSISWLTINKIQRFRTYGRPYTCCDDELPKLLVLIYVTHPVLCNRKNSNQTFCATWIVNKKIGFCHFPTFTHLGKIRQVWTRRNIFISLSHCPKMSDMRFKKSTPSLHPPPWRTLHYYISYFALPYTLANFKVRITLWEWWINFSMAIYIPNSEIETGFQRFHYWNLV